MCNAEMNSTLLNFSYKVDQSWSGEVRKDAMPLGLSNTLLFTHLNNDYKLIITYLCSIPDFYGYNHLFFEFFVKFELMICCHNLDCCVLQGTM